MNFKTFILKQLFKYHLYCVKWANRLEDYGLLTYDNTAEKWLTRHKIKSLYYWARMDNKNLKELMIFLSNIK